MIKLIFCLILSIFLFSCSSLQDKNFKNEYGEVVIISDIPGSGISIKNHYKVTVHYIGILEDGTEFDNNYKRNQIRRIIQGLTKINTKFDK